MIGTKPFVSSACLISVALNVKYLPALPSAVLTLVGSIWLCLPPACSSWRSFPRPGAGAGFPPVPLNWEGALNPRKSRWKMELGHEWSSQPGKSQSWREADGWERHIHDERRQNIPLGYQGCNSPVQNGVEQLFRSIESQKGWKGF